MNSVTQEIANKLVNMLTLNEIIRLKRHGWKSASVELRKAMLDFEKNGVEFRRELIKEQKEG